MENAIFEKINSRASYLTQEDLDGWILPEITDIYRSKIQAGAYKVYGYNSGEVSLSAYKEIAKFELRKALDNFIFKKQHWKNNRNLNQYLLATLKYLSERSYWDQSCVKRAQLAVCPGCKFLGTRSYLVSDGKHYRCEFCFSEKDRLDLESKSNDEEAVKRQKIHQIFSFHSKKGYRCQDCSRFLPNNLQGLHGISCPYPDCNFFGDVSNLALMAHPVGLCHRTMLSLDAPLEEGENTTFVQKIDAKSISAEDFVYAEQNFKLEFSALKSVIDAQMSRVRRMNGRSTAIQKLLMYEAFKVMIEKYPTEMVSYLVHQKQHADFPVQSKIFQEYVMLIGDSLPFSIEKNGEEHEILSISDPELGIFIGESVFTNEVKAGNIITNKTVETYTGGRKNTFFGPCFIGFVTDVVDVASGKSIKNNIKSYTFAQVEMDDTIAVGTKVEVTHYRIPSHYEMGALVFLQRIRRMIVDGVYLKLHGKKREVKRTAAL